MFPRNAALAACFALTFAGCEKNPVERLTNPLPGGVVPQASEVYTIYDDELKTGGGLAFIPGGENQVIDLRDQSGPRRSTNHIRYVWNGGDVFNAETGQNQHLFAGFQLLVSPDFTDFASTGGKDLSAGGFTKMVFHIRGELSQETRLRIEGPAAGTEAPDETCSQTGCQELTSLSSGWQRVEIPISAARLGNVKIFATVTFQYDQPPRTTVAGNGGVVHLDDIRYER